MPTVTCKCLNAVYKEAEAVIRKQAASVAAELSRLTGKEHAAGSPMMTEADDGRFRCEIVVGETGRDSVVNAPNKARLAELIKAFEPSKFKTEAYEVDEEYEVKVPQPSPTTVVNGVTVINPIAVYEVEKRTRKVTKHRMVPA